MPCLGFRLLPDALVKALIPLGEDWRTLIRLSLLAWVGLLLGLAAYFHLRRRRRFYGWFVVACVGTVLNLMWVMFAAAFWVLLMNFPAPD